MYDPIMVLGLGPTRAISRSLDAIFAVLNLYPPIAPATNDSCASRVETCVETGVCRNKGMVAVGSNGAGALQTGCSPFEWSTMQQ